MDITKNFARLPNGIRTFAAQWLRVESTTLKSLEMKFSMFE
jgi:hypothetical protein